MKKNLLKNRDMNKKKVNELLLKGIPLRLISQKFGHSSVDTIVSIYFKESCEVSNVINRQINDLEK